MLPLKVVQGIGKQCHKNVGARNTADVFDNLADDNNRHIVGCCQTDCIACHDHDAANHKQHAFFHFLGQRDDEKHSQSHRYTAQHLQDGRCDAVVVAAKDVIAVIQKACIAQNRHKLGQCKDGENQQHIRFRQAGFDLHCIRYGGFVFLVGFLGNTLFGVVVFQQGQRQHKN